MNRNVKVCFEHCAAFAMRRDGSSCGKHLFPLCYVGCGSWHHTNPKKQCDVRNCDREREVPKDCPFSLEMVVS